MNCACIYRLCFIFIEIDAYLLMVLIMEGDLKKRLVQETGLEPKDQRLLFRGKEIDDQECLQQVGVKDRSKLLLLEEMASKERKLEEARRSDEISKACKAVAEVKAEVDKLLEKVVLFVPYNHLIFDHGCWFGLLYLVGGCLRSNCEWWDYRWEQGVCCLNRVAHEAVIEIGWHRGWRRSKSAEKGWG